jgi:hypothetical protein
MTYTGLTFLADAIVLGFLVLTLYFIVTHWKEEP